MADPLDTQSQEVAGALTLGQNALAEAERIFDTETTSSHRQQWPNVFRLEAATKYARNILAVAEPEITPSAAANELQAAAVQARDAIRAAVDSGGGDITGSADRLINAARNIPPGPALEDLPGIAALRDEIEKTRAETKTQIGEAAAEVAGQKDQAFAAINEAVDAIAIRREAADQQASELGLVTSHIAAENLADTYAVEAKRTEHQAKRYTFSSLAVGVLSVAVTVIGLLTVKEASSFQTVIGHAAFGIPVALLAAYINSLATNHRLEAWRLRHLELQIRTANPFLGLLDTERREETLAALALRFFPGQEGVSFDGGSSGVPAPEMVELLRALVQRQVSTPAAPPAPASEGAN